MAEIIGEVNHYTVVRTYDNDVEIVNERTADIVTIDKDYLEDIIELIGVALKDIGGQGEG